MYSFGRILKYPFNPIRGMTIVTELGEYVITCIEWSKGEHNRYQMKNKATGEHIVVTHEQFWLKYEQGKLCWR